MLTRALAVAFAPKVTVNSVAPGVIPFDHQDERIERLVAATQTVADARSTRDALKRS